MAFEYNEDHTKLIRALSDDWYITICDELTSIADGAFKDNKNIRTLTLSNVERVIGKSMCEDCTNIEWVQMGVIKEIPDRAFANCTSLMGVDIPRTVTSIGDNAFLNCKSLMHIYLWNNIASISATAFNGCDNITCYIGDSPYTLNYCKTHNLKYKVFDIINDITPVYNESMEDNIEDELFTSVIEEVNGDMADNEHFVEQTLSTDNEPYFDATIVNVNNVESAYTDIDVESIAVLATDDNDIVKSDNDEQSYSEETSYIEDIIENEPYYDVTMVGIDEKEGGIETTFDDDIVSDEPYCEPILFSENEPQSNPTMLDNKPYFDATLSEPNNTDDEVGVIGQPYSDETMNEFDNIDNEPYFDATIKDLDNTDVLEHTEEVVNKETDKLGGISESCSIEPVVRESSNNGSVKKTSSKDKKGGTGDTIEQLVLVEDERGNIQIDVQIEPVEQPNLKCYRNSNETGIYYVTPETRRSEYNGNRNIKELRIVNGVIEIPQWVSAYCINLEKLVLASSVKKIGAYAFYGCTNLKAVENAGNLLTMDIGMDAFKGCKFRMGSTEK